MCRGRGFFSTQNTFCSEEASLRSDREREEGELAMASPPKEEPAAAGGTAPTPTNTLRKPTFTTVDQLRPGTSGHTLTVKVVSSKLVLQKARPDGTHLRHVRISECIVGDETGVVVFTARNDQVDMVKEGVTLIIRNAKIDMFKGSMRLAVDKWGRIEVTEPASFIVKEDNNLSLVEYELVHVEGQ